MKQLGFIGVGVMGIRMAGRLLDAGYPLVVYDVNETAMQRLEQRGAKRAASPADVASQCEIVLASLPNPDIVKSVAFGKDGVTEGTKVKMFVDLSTTGPKAAKEISAALAANGITAVDAPVSDGPTGAEQGTLAMMVSAPKPAADALRPVIERLGKFFHVGTEPGLGQTMKVINNLMSATAQMITAESMVMGVKAGLDPQAMIDVINAGSGRNTASEDKFPRCVLNRRFDFGGTTAMIYKDVKLCLDEAEALGVPMMVGNAVKHAMGIGKATVGPKADLTELVKTIEQWAGVEVGKKA
jgi:3-hydroxyisobutyrate dehydrogenase-like beta-hydroxyacid dehydrogenase